MPEEVQQQQAATPPGWISGLPDTLKSNEAFTKFKTVGDFANDYLSVSSKANELEKKVENSVPKLPDDASPEERSLYFDALGRPKQPSEYEFDGEDKNDPEWTTQWKQKFHSLGLTKAQAAQLSKEWNGTMQSMVEQHNAKIKTEIAAAETALKSEWGPKFDTNVELAKRVYQKHIGNDMDKDFDAGTEKTRLAMIRFVVKMASLTGEDRSPQSGQAPSGFKPPNGMITYDKSPAPPARH